MAIARSIATATVIASYSYIIVTAKSTAIATVIYTEIATTITTVIYTSIATAIATTIATVTVFLNNLYSKSICHGYFK